MGKNCVFVYWKLLVLSRLNTPKRSNDSRSHLRLSRIRLPILEREELA